MGTAHSGSWDQEAFDRADRRGAGHLQAARGEKGHDLLRLDHPAESRDAVQAIVHAATRHVDVLHLHEGALVMSCPLNDAAGLRAKLEGLFAASGLAVEMSHGTFSGGTDIGANVASLK